MAYGHSTRVSASKAAVRKALARAAGTWGGYQAWRPLDAERRLQVVEEALKCTGVGGDGYPLAL